MPESVYYDYDGVKVTDRRLVVGEKTYPVVQIASVSTTKSSSKGSGCLALVFVGGLLTTLILLMVLLGGGYSDAAVLTQVFVGSIAMTGFVGWIVFKSKDRHVVTVTNAARQKIELSYERRVVVTEILRAINDAVAGETPPATPVQPPPPKPKPAPKPKPRILEGKRVWLAAGMITVILFGISLSVTVAGLVHQGDPAYLWRSAWESLEMDREEPEQIAVEPTPVPCPGEEIERTMYFCGIDRDRNSGAYGELLFRDGIKAREGYTSPASYEIAAEYAHHDRTTVTCRVDLPAGEGGTWYRLRNDAWIRSIWLTPDPCTQDNLARLSYD